MALNYADIDNSIIKGREALIEVLKATNSIDDWSNLGLLMGLEPHQLKSIQRTSTNPKMEIIQAWLDTGKASWAKLAEYLCDGLVNQVGIAKEIAAKHKAGNDEVAKLKEENKRLKEEIGRLLKRLQECEQKADAKQKENIEDELKKQLKVAKADWEAKKEKLETNNAKKLFQRDEAIAAMRDELDRTKKHHQEFLVKFKQVSEGELLELSKMILAQAQKGDVNEVSKLVLLGADIHYTDKNNQTALHVASEAGHTDVVQVLLSHGAKVDVKDNEASTSLHLASKNGHTKIVDILLSHGATVDIKENSFQTALHLATIRGHTEVVQALLMNGASPSIRADRKQAPLHRASENGHVEIVKLLIEYKASVNVKNQFGNSPLHLASAKGATEIVELLIENGHADIDDPNGVDSRSPLHEACQRGRTEVVKSLLSHKASINVKDQHDQSPLHIALLQGHIDTAMVLLSAGADITVKDKYGQTPILIAVVLKLENILKFFQSKRGLTKEDLQEKYELPLMWKASLDEEEPERIIYTNDARKKQQHEHPKAHY